MRYRMTAPILVSLVLSSLSMSAHAVRAQVIRGWVLRADGRALAESTVRLRGADGEVLVQVFTGADGRFELTAPGGGGRMRLQAVNLGFADWETAPFELDPDADLEVLITLQVEPIPLDEILVEARRARTTRRLADFERRREIQAFGGFFIDEEDIARRPASRPSNLVLAAPGMSVRGGGGAFDFYQILSYDCIANVYVDGVRIDQRGASVDEYLELDRIAGVEVYPRAASAPPQYQDAVRRECGTVLYWTKELEPDGPEGWTWRKIALGAVSFGAVVTLILAR